MENFSLIKYIKDPSQLNNNTLTILEKEICKYPYFIPLQILYLKNLKNLSSPDFIDKLKIISPQVLNRTLLQEFLERSNEEFLDFNESITTSDSEVNTLQKSESKISHTLKQASGWKNVESEEELKYTNVSINAEKEYGKELERVEVKKNDTETLDFLETSPSTNGNKEVDISIKKIRASVSSAKGLLELEYKPKELKTESPKVKPVTESNKVGELKKEYTAYDLLEEEKKYAEQVGNKSFSDWISSISSSRGVKPEENTKIEQKYSRQNLIDNFINQEPSIKPDKSKITNEVFDISEKSIEEKEGLLSDTLAQIYVKQGYFEKAISAYEKLSLKFPEKSSYFADQIEEIKKLI